MAGRINSPGNVSESPEGQEATGADTGESESLGAQEMSRNETHNVGAVRRRHGSRVMDLCGADGEPLEETPFSSAAVNVAAVPLPRSAALATVNVNHLEKDSSQSTTKAKRKKSSAAASSSAGSNKRPALPVLQFPAALFSDAVYSAGIRLENPHRAPANYVLKRGSAKLKKHVKTPQEKKRYPYTDHRPPSLTATENKLWFHSAAAGACAERHFPVAVNRLLGVVSRTVTETCRSTAPVLSGNRCEHKQFDWPEVEPKKAPAFSKHQAMKEAKMDAMKNDGTRNGGTLEVEAATNKVEWDNVLKQGVARTAWDKRGEMHPEVVNDPSYITCYRLLELLNKKKLSDDHADQHKSLYNGLIKLPCDTITVLKSLLELASPIGLYNIPAVIPYTCIQLESSVPADQTGQVTRRYRLQIGVYCNRMLFEIMTQQLHIVMSALDEGSYRITQPLHLPPTPATPTFASSPYPTVVFDDEEDDNDDSPEETDGDNDVIMMDSTRDESTVSAFTPRGLLKMLESHGNDISSWPAVQKAIESSLQVELMLHQIHGVCWMMQMEHLGGFGLNSCVWEEREFADGGKWYYSPAVGQVRLSLGGKLGRPSVVKGGMLVDEMGLGKSIEVLALILATLDELKQEAASKPSECEHKHATLIVVPPALLSQWLSEIRKVTGDSLVYEVFDSSTLEFQCKSTKQGLADIVVTTYSALETKKKNSPAKSLHQFSWGRVVLDEMQEIRSSTTAIAKNCEGLQCERRWMLSGTPLFEGVEDLRGELCFLRLEPFAGSLDDGFFNFAVMNHWEARSRNALDTLRVLSLLMLRRSKSMTICESSQPLLGLKPLTLVVEPVPQDRPERALYCFLEFLVHSTITHEGGTDITKNKTFLRFLREMCVSPALLNGGLSCTSQLPILNRLMVDHNRREHSEASMQEETADEPSDFMSCDQAIRFLSQVQDAAGVHEDYATSLVVGGGGGISRRNRATDSIELQNERAQEKLSRATLECDKARTKRAKALWHKALELITTGALCFGAASTTTVSPSILKLWKWRRLLRTHQIVEDQPMKFPTMLTRGWRPSEAFFYTASSKRAKANWHRLLQGITQGKLNLHTTTGMSKSTKRVLRMWKWRFLLVNVLPGGQELVGRFRPNKKIDRTLSLRGLFKKLPSFEWAHPFSLLLEAIPVSVTVKEVHHSILQVLADQAVAVLARMSNGRVKVVRFQRPSEAVSHWKAIVQFANPVDFETALKKAHTTNGIGLVSSETFEWIEAELVAAKAKFEEAAAENKVYPCDANKKDENVAKQAYDTARRGLRMIAKDKCRSGHVTCSRSFGGLRDVKPKSCFSLYNSTRWLVEEQTDKLAFNQAAQAEHSKTAERLGAMLSNSKFSSQVQTLSAFDALQALRNGETEKTQCPICLEHLGSDARQKDKVALTRCGHLFCIACLDDFKRVQYAQGAYAPPCPSCRRSVKFNEIQLVDPKLTADDEAFERKRSEAKSLVQGVASSLDASNGQLEPHLWEALYLAIDLPLDADKSHHGTFTAIPGNVLAHLRHATGMPVHSGSGGVIDNSVQLSSKLRALLQDLPSDERSVVFASSKQAVKHVMAVLDLKGIESRGLFTGQTEEKSGHAVEEWKANNSTNVLVVQSGAAACGLTLTAACKMFILEPFVKHEEEQQAYARLHRYGQEHAVVCKIYYVPVSVESRLLEWRKRATGQAATEETVVFAPMRTSTETAVEEDAEIAEHNQTRFLLGLENRGEEGDESLDV